VVMYVPSGPLAAGNPCFLIQFDTVFLCLPTMVAMDAMPWMTFMPRHNAINCCTITMHSVILPHGT